MGGNAQAITNARVGLKDAGFRRQILPVKPVFAFFAVVAAFVAGPARADAIGERLAAAALERTTHRVVYDASYARIAYPMGDVAPDRGVCSDVVVRSMRALGLDLQQLVHEDMTAAFNAYPAHWGLAAPDPNIDHRRVPNLEKFLMRNNMRLAPSRDPEDYQPGDIVAWNLKGASGGWLAHIGIVTGETGPSGAPMVVHNIGAGPKHEDVLFAWPMTGRYRLRDDFVEANASPG